MSYNVFISYRRQGGIEIARAIKSELEKLGYSVFLDFDELNDGLFEKHIIKAIESSDVFMLILSEDALDSCANEKDWVRKEIEYAIQNKRHIVPVNPDQRFTKVPDELPVTLRETIESTQISDLMLGQLFQASLNKVVEERILPYLQNNERNTPTRVHVRANEDCTMSIFGKHTLDLKKNKFATINLTPGKYSLEFTMLNGKQKIDIDHIVESKTDDLIEANFQKSK